MNTEIEFIPATIAKRSYPCICCACPKCNTIFMAAALKEEYHNDADANRQLLNDLAKYAAEGYNIYVKNADEFKINRCEHL